MWAALNTTNYKAVKYLRLNQPYGRKAQEQCNTILSECPPNENLPCNDYREIVEISLLFLGYSAW
jgi:hypothetical protein